MGRSYKKESAGILFLFGFMSICGVSKVLHMSAQVTFSPKSEEMNAVSQVFINEQSHVMNLRKETLAKGCRKHSTSFLTASDTFYAAPADALYCSIPKVASSFMETVFYVLGKDRGKDNGNNSPLDISGVSIHGMIPEMSVDKLGTFKDPHSLNRRFGNSTKMMFTRDPYGKIFSAFCDKLLTNCIPGINNRIFEWKLKRNQTFDLPMGMLNVSFSDALQYATRAISDGVDQHFRSPSEFCDVCNIDYDFVGKVESLNDDLKFILSYINNTKILDAMGDVDSKNERTIVSDILARTFALMNSKDCIYIEEILRRVWKLFQIRGFISDSQHFPWKNRKTICALTKDIYTSDALRAVEASEDRVARKAQRSNYRLQAFRSVPLSVLQRYRAHVQRDCDLFGYDCSPDDIFAGRAEGDEESNVFSDVKYIYMN